VLGVEHDTMQQIRAASMRAQYYALKTKSLKLGPAVYKNSSGHIILAGKLVFTYVCPARHSANFTP
jgi:hypothetical protein